MKVYSIYLITGGIKKNKEFLVQYPDYEFAIKECIDRNKEVLKKAQWIANQRCIQFCQIEIQQI